MAKTNFEAARNILADRLCNYRGFKKCELILVFDAYKVKGNPGEELNTTTLRLFTPKRPKQQICILKKLQRKSVKNTMYVLPHPDGLEQIIILGHGALRLSARAFHEEVEFIEKAIRDFIN